ncbi:IS3 family transposase [Paenisporosarcina sp. TG20]
MNWYNNKRSNSSLSHLSPVEYKNLDPLKCLI